MLYPILVQIASFSITAGNRASAFTTAIIADHELLIDHQGNGSFINVPKLEAGDYDLLLDDQDDGEVNGLRG